MKIVSSHVYFCAFEVAQHVKSNKAASWLNLKKKNTFFLEARENILS